MDDVLAPGHASGRGKLVSIVIPILNEVENIEELHRRLAALAPQLDRDLEFVFVDDGSTDGSFTLLAALGARDPRAKVLRLSRNFGSHGACLAGLAHSRGDHVVVLSADLQDPPELIADMLAAAEQGHDIVLGSRERRADPAATIFFSSLYNRIMRRIAIASWPEAGFDFLLVSRRVLDVVLSRRESNTSIFGQILWTGFAHTSVPYRRGERHAGRSKWTVGKKLKLAIDSFVSFSYVPIRMISALGLMFASGGLLFALFVVALRLVRGTPVSGWASLMVALLVIGGIQIVMLGVIGEYLWRAVDEVRARPPFIVAEKLGFDAVAATAPAALSGGHQPGK